MILERPLSNYARAGPAPELCSIRVRLEGFIAVKKAQVSDSHKARESQLLRAKRSLKPGLPKEREPVNRLSHDKELLKVRDSRSNQCSKARFSRGGDSEALLVS